MIYREALKEDFNPVKKIYDYGKFKYQFAKDNPDYFIPDGLLCFVGPQGSGKTLTAVNYVYNLMKSFPKCMLVTNLALTDYPVDNKRIFKFRNNDDLKRYKNGKFGVIFLIDEIQLYFNSLQSKNINMDVMTQISQQRKQRIHIVCTSQVFGRMAKPLREQFSCVVKCQKYFGFVQKCSVVDRDSIDEESSDSMELKGKVLFSSWYIHTPKYFNRYDTYAVISNNSFVPGERQIQLERSSSNGN